MSANWYYGAGDGQRSGPVVFNQLKKLFGSGTLKPNAMVWNEEGCTRVPAHVVPGLLPVAPASHCPKCFGLILTNDPEISSLDSPFFIGKRCAGCTHRWLVPRSMKALIVVFSVLAIAALFLVAVIAGVFSGDQVPPLPSEKKGPPRKDYYSMAVVWALIVTIPLGRFLFRCIKAMRMKIADG